MEQLKENLFLNDVEDINASVLRWGTGLRGTWVEDECNEWPYDVVLGSDIVSIQKGLSISVFLLTRFFRHTTRLQYLR